MKLSEGQKGILFLSNLNDKISSAYNMCYAYSIEGELNTSHFLSATNCVLASHEAFQIRISNDGTLENYQLAQAVERLSSRESELPLEQEYKRESSTPFHLFNSQLIRLVIGKPSKQQNYIIFNIHHLIFDDISADIFIREVCKAYSLLCSGTKYVPNEKELSLNSIVEAEKKFIHSSECDDLLNKSSTKLNDYPRHINWLSDAKVEAAYRANYLETELPSDLRYVVNDFAKQYKVTKTALFISVYIIAIWHFSSQKRIPVCLPISSRNSLNQDKIGYFTNMGIVALSLDSNSTFEEFLESVSDELFDQIDQRFLPFQCLSRAIRGVDNGAYGTFTQLSFNFINNADASNDLLFKSTGIVKQRHYPRYIKNQFKLDIEESNNRLLLSFLYDADSIDKKQVTVFSKHYQYLLSLLCKQPQLSLSQVPVLNAENFNLIVNQFNATHDSSIFEHSSVYSTFLKTAEEHAENVAISFDGIELTYHALLKKVNCFASLIARSANTTDDNIALIYLDRSIEMIVSILACVRLGITFLPVSTESPLSRVKKLVRHAGVNILVTSNDTAVNLVEEDLHKITLEELNCREVNPDNLPPFKLSNTSAIYLIYTSGTTGEPKGILIPEIALRNRIKWMQDTYNIGVGDNVLQKTPISFDVSMWEVFWPLMTGAKMTIAQPNKHKDIHHINGLIRNEGITHLHFVPSMFSEFVKTWEPSEGSTLKQVFCSGEPLKKDDIQGFYEKHKHVALTNLYGPTETTIDSTYWECSELEKTARVLIGKPIANTETYILNEDLQPVPIGVLGDLYIAGLGLAQGYLNNEVSNKERFVEVPLLPNKRLYKTGDKAAFTADGNIDYRGREDDQVKIRGVRIELCGLEEEIKAAYEGLDNVALKVYKDNRGEDSLACYYSLKSSHKAEEINLRSTLVGTIPEYSIPSSIVKLERFHYTTSGKVDKKALPEPVLVPEQGSDQKSFAEDEFLMKGIWEEVLGIQINSKQQDFFSLGGHSLLATQIVFKTKEVLGVDINAMDLFTQPTIQELCDHIRYKKSNPHIEQLTFGNGESLGLEG